MTHPLHQQMVRIGSNNVDAHIGDVVNSDMEIEEIAEEAYSMAFDAIYDEFSIDVDIESMRHAAHEVARQFA